MNLDDIRAGLAAMPRPPWDDPEQMITSDAAEFYGAAPETMDRMLAALDAVTELHTPVEDRNWLGGEANQHLWCSSCGSIDDSPEAYPCPTLRAITTALEGPTHE